MELTFRGGSEHVVICVDKESNLWIASALTNHKSVKFTHELFTDRTKRFKTKFMLGAISKLNREQKMVYITREFKKMGYVLIKKTE